MSYQPGKMGIAEGASLVFIITITSLFLPRWSVYFDDVATAAWMVPLFGAVTFILMFLVLLFVMERVPGDLLEVAERLLGKIGGRLLSLYLVAVFFSDAILLLRQFADNTLLTAIPDMDMSFIMLWYVLLASVVVYIGIEPLARSAFVMMPFGVIGTVAMMLLLYGEINIYRLAPWFGNGLTSIFQTSVLSSGLYLNAFLLPLMATSFQNLKTVRTSALLGVGFATLMRTAIFFLYTGIFGVAVGREKILPFFEMARLVYVNRFIQRVEAFFIILWVIFGLATIAINLYITIYILTRLCNLSSTRPLIIPVALITAQLALLPSDIVTVVLLHYKSSMSFFPMGVFLIPIVLWLAFFIKTRKKVEAWDTD